MRKQESARSGQDLLPLTCVNEGTLSDKTTFLLQFVTEGVVRYTPPVGYMGPTGNRGGGIVHACIIYDCIVHVMNSLGAAPSRPEPNYPGMVLATRDAH